MIPMKKLFRDDLFNLALLLSFLKLNSIDISLDLFARPGVPVSPYEVSLGTSYGYYPADLRNLMGIHHLERVIPNKYPGSDIVDNLIISELNELGSFNQNISYSRDIYAYLLNDEAQTSLESIDAQTPQSNTSPDNHEMQSASVSSDNRVSDGASTSSECELSSEVWEIL